MIYYEVISILLEINYNKIKKPPTALNYWLVWRQSIIKRSVRGFSKDYTFDNIMLFS